VLSVLGSVAVSDFNGVVLSVLGSVAVNSMVLMESNGDNVS
jgi:hypothetical protein